MPSTPSQIVSLFRSRGYDLPRIDRLPFKDETVCAAIERNRKFTHGKWTVERFTGFETLAEGAEAQRMWPKLQNLDTVHCLATQQFCIKETSMPAMYRGDGLRPVALTITEATQYSGTAEANWRPWKNQAPETKQGLFIAEAQARDFLWRRFGLNLEALTQFQATGHSGELSILNLESAHVHAYGEPIQDGDAFVVSKRHTFERSEPHWQLADLFALVGGIEGQAFAFADGRNLKNHGPENPLLGCALTFDDNNETASASYYTDAGVTPFTSVPFDGLRGKAKTQLQKVFRLRAEANQARDAIAAAAMDAHREMRERGEYSAKQTPVESGLIEKQEARYSTIRAEYIDLLAIATKRREDIFAKARKRAQVQVRIEKAEALLGDRRDAFTRVASDIRAVLPHMSVLPADVEARILRPGEGFVAEAVGHVVRPGTLDGKERQLNFSLVQDDIDALPDLLTAASSIFGPQGYAWLFPLAYVALARLYADANAFNQPGDVKTSANDFWTTIRPNAAQEIRKKGLNDWWRRNHKKDADKTPSDLFIAIMDFLRRVNLPVIQNGKMVEVAGVIQVSEFSKSTRGQHEIHWRFNPAMERFITGGDNAAPLFMVTDHQALFGYSKKSLHLAPAMQLMIESHTRTNVFKGLFTNNNGTLLTPQGDGFSLGRIAEKLGMVERAPNRYEKRITDALDALGDAGVVTDWTFQGAKRLNWAESKVEITVSDKYKAAYEIAQLQRDRARIDKQLQTPFAPTRRRSIQKTN